jgi:signal transduction histidine kinase
VILRACNVLAVVALLGLIGFSLFAWSRRIDERSCTRYGQQLRSLLALDLRLTAEVMKTRAGLVAHYDAVVQTVAARRRLSSTLHAAPRGLWPEADPVLRRRLELGERRRRDTDQLVERFTREMAVLRNSLRFLPVLASELERPLGVGRSAEQHGALAGLIRDELLLQSWQDGELTSRIDQTLATLVAQEGAATGAGASDLTMLVSHARLVRERTPIVQTLTRQIASARDAAWTEDMLSRFLQRQRAAQRVADFDASVRFVLALVLLAAVAASIIAKLRASSAALRQTSQRLTRAVESLRVEQAKQRELGELKSRFVSMASHEFRTPLSVIVSSSELLEAYGERWSGGKKQEHFTRIRQAAASMTRMLDDILTIGKRNAGLLRFEPKPLQIGSFCADVVEALGAASGQTQRIVYTRPLTREQVVADPVLLRHVLENLLSNALKYSPAEAPVELSVAREEKALRFDVSVRGIGISQDDQQRLFETFHRGKNVGEISGTGLGLAIVRGAVELHGGQVTVHSALGAGTRFTVRIPVSLARGTARFDCDGSEA